MQYEPSSRRQPLLHRAAPVRALWVLACLAGLVGSPALSQEAPRQTASGTRLVIPPAHAVPAAKAAPARRLALVIGNGRYARIGPLRNPVNDARDLCDKLASLRFDVQCLEEVDSKAAFRQAVRGFAARIDRNSLVFFYYAGHAFQTGGENFLVPTGIDPTTSLDVEEDSISLSYVLRSLSAARGAANVVVLDACRDDPFSADTPGSPKRGLAKVEDQPPNTMLVYATAPGAVAHDGDSRERHGLFTKHLLNELDKPGRSLSNVMDSVAQAVGEEARTRYGMEQRPYRSSSYSGSICLVSCAEESIAARLAELQEKSDEAALRIKVLEAENQRLAAYSTEQQQHAADLKVNVSRLEGRLHELTESAGSARSVSDRTRAEIERLQAELAAARAVQKEREAILQDVRQRENALLEESRKLSESQQQIRELQEQNRAQARLLREQARPSRVTSPNVVIPSF